MRQLADAADRALDEARRAITVLSAAQPQSLSCAVAQTAEDLGERLELAVHLDLAQDIDIPGDVTENLLRILREAMTNSAQHGASRQVRVRLERAGGLRLVVEDDGCGFDPLDATLSKGFRPHEHEGAGRVDRAPQPGLEPGVWDADRDHRAMNGARSPVLLADDPRPDPPV